MSERKKNASVADMQLRQVISHQPFPLIFATLSGAHLYGFPSPDSDFDLRGCHLLPLKEVVGFDHGRETIEWSAVNNGLEIDRVTHDARKFFGLLLKKNGYVLEQLYSPLVIHETPEHSELKTIAHNCVTRHHNHHYRAFAETQWRLFEKERPPRVKPLLYVYRVLLTGIHLMRSSLVETNLVRLNEEARLAGRRLDRAKAGGSGIIRPQRRRNRVPPARIRPAAGRAGRGPFGQQSSRNADSQVCPE